MRPENITVTVGQEVAVRSGYGMHRPTFGYRVTRITPKGQVLVRRESDGYEMRFNPQGYEMRDNRIPNYSATLVVDVEGEKVRIARQDAIVAAGHLIEQVQGRSTRGAHATKEALVAEIAELESKLAAAKAAVDAI